MDERRGQALRRQRGERRVDAVRARQVARLAAADPDDRAPDGTLGAEPVRCAVGPDDLPVGDPELVVRRRPEGRLAGGHPRVIRVPERDLRDRDLLAGDAEAVLLDAHPEGVEPELGVAHEREELGHGRERVSRERDQFGTRTAPDRHRQVGGAVPDAARGHGRDCSGGLDMLVRSGVYIVTRYIDNRYIIMRVQEGAMISLRRLTVTVGLLGAALALAGAFAAPSVAGGATQASATIVDASGATIGWARLVEDATGVVHVNVHVDGLTPGLHGIHIHGVGACTPTFAAAGGHYNPLARQHGLLNEAGAHAGDLPNLIVNESGVAHLDATTDRVTLRNGPTTLFDTTAGAVGSALIIHANEDDQVPDATNGASGRRM